MLLLPPSLGSRGHENKYDRSGRSSGAGVVTFETAAEAAHAKDRYQGALAKGAFAFMRSQAGTSGTVFQAGDYDRTRCGIEFEIGDGGGSRGSSGRRGSRMCVVTGGRPGSF